jgi:adenosylhomocysteinase
VIVTEIDPICALQAAMDGYQVARLEDVIGQADIVITDRQQRRHHGGAHGAMKHQAIVGNIGHFDNEIDMAGLAALPGVVRKTIKPQVDEWTFADGNSIIVLSEGRLLNLGNATGHPSFVMRTRSPTRSWRRSSLHQADEYPLGVYTLPKHLDENLDALGVRLTS